MGTKAESKRVRRYVRSKGCPLIEDVVMTAEAVIGVPVPSPCHTTEMQSLVNAMEALRTHVRFCERLIAKVKRNAE